MSVFGSLGVLRDKPIPPPPENGARGYRELPIAFDGAANKEPLVALSEYGVRGENFYAQPRNPPYYLIVPGSIEALMSPGRILSYDDYVSVEMLGRKRCRLSPDHRPLVYKAFKAYSKFLSETGRWDDSDRISSLLQCFQTTKEKDPERFERLRYSKIYVDEVQDYTQGEILLFFYLSRPGDLFLCGDPAQSVVAGVEFRFEEIRSVAHFVAGAERRHLVPQKPLVVNVNFRSHSGILNVAAAACPACSRSSPTALSN